MTNLHLSLEKKYAALVGELENVRANIARIEREQMKLPQMQSRTIELEGLVDSAANLLKSITPDWTPDHIEPTKPWTHTLPIPFGSCGRRALAILRESQTGMTTRQLAIEVLRGVGVEEPDRLVIRKTTVAVEPFCPYCGCAAVYKFKTRRKFKCQSCHRQFSVTSQTIFASRKLEFRDMLYVIAIFTNGAKGMSALELIRHVNVQYKTAFVLLHKLREALSQVQAENSPSGEVEMDGAYFGGYVKPANEADKRRDRRKLVNQNGKRKCVVVMRERGGKSRPFICSESEAASLAVKHIAPNSIVYTDENKAYDQLDAIFAMKRIDHSKRYADGDVSTNQAESFFSRLRRSEQGVHHQLAGPNFDTYSGEMSWREDNRRVSNGEQFLTIASAGLHHPVSRRWKGYWQRSKAA